MKLYIGLAGPVLLIFYLPLVLIGLLVLAHSPLPVEQLYLSANRIRPVMASTA